MKPAPVSVEQRIAVLREAVDRADALASTQAMLIATQREYMKLQDAYVQSIERRVREMESQIAEMRCAL